jgi:hypothetical protein
VSRRSLYALHAIAGSADSLDVMPSYKAYATRFIFSENERLHLCIPSRVSHGNVPIFQE